MFLAPLPSRRRCLRIAKRAFEQTSGMDGQLNAPLVHLGETHLVMITTPGLVVDLEAAECAKSLHPDIEIRVVADLLVNHMQDVQGSEYPRSSAVRTRSG